MSKQIADSSAPCSSFLAFMPVFRCSAAHCFDFICSPSVIHLTAVLPFLLFLFLFLFLFLGQIYMGMGSVRIKKAHSKVMRSIRISHEGKWGITGGYDKCVKLWNLFEGKCIGIGAAGEIGRVDTDKYGHLECVMGCDLRAVVHPGDARPGGWGCSSSFDGTVKLWDLRGMKLVETMRGHKGHVWDSRLSQSADENRQTLVSCGADATVRVWSVPEGNPLTVLEGHTKEITSIALRLDGLVAATASFDMCCRTWDLRREGERKTMQLASDRSSCCGLSQVILDPL